MPKKLEKKTDSVWEDSLSKGEQPKPNTKVCEFVLVETNKTSSIHWDVGLEAANI